MSDQAKGKIERLILLTDRLAEMLSADVKALERSGAKSLHSTEHSFQQLMLTYTREAVSVNAPLMKSVSPELRQKLMLSAKAMNDLLARHQRLVTRVRNASEGMIRAIAKEVERRQVSQRSYARMPTARPQASGAMVYNSVI
jgi:predicted sulfurtransferase